MVEPDIESRTDPELKKLYYVKRSVVAEKALDELFRWSTVESKKDRPLEWRLGPVLFAEGIVRDATVDCYGFGLNYDAEQSVLWLTLAPLNEDKYEYYRLSERFIPRIDVGERVRVYYEVPPRDETEDEIVEKKNTIQRIDREIQRNDETRQSIDKVVSWGEIDRTIVDLLTKVYKKEGVGEKEAGFADFELFKKELVIYTRELESYKGRFSFNYGGVLGLQMLTPDGLQAKFQVAYARNQFLKYYTPKEFEEYLEGRKCGFR